MSARQVYFISGAYGVGKTTLCDKLSQKIGIPAYSASDLISPKVDEQYGAQKSVKDKDKNQQALLHAVEELPLDIDRIILSGHFCIFNRHQEVEALPDFVFNSLGITKIVLLVAEATLIMERLQMRDKIAYQIESINNLIQYEHQMATRIANMLGCPLCTYTMQFNDIDVDSLAEFLLQG